MRLRTVVIPLACLVAVAAILFGYREYLVRELRKPVLALLTDPDAALFRNEAYVGPWTSEGGSLCGEVNTRNRAGGYIGYQHFAAITKGASLSERREEECDARLGPWWWLRW